MRRRSLLAAAAGAAGCGRRRARLNVFNWSSYIAPDTLPDFEAETGIRVRYSVYESNEELLAKILAGNSGWDVVFPSNYLIGPLREYNLLARLRPERLANLDQLSPRFRAPEWDPKLEWCVPYMWGATGILYNRVVAPPPSSWADLWDDRLTGRVTMLDDPAEVFGACLRKLGHSVNSTSEAPLRAAQRQALAQKRLLRAYLNAEVRDQVVAGDVLAAQMWTTTAQQALEGAAHLGFSFPREGFALYADNAVLLRESGRQEESHRFIDFLLRPEVNAAIARTALAPTTNAGAMRLLPDAVRRSPVLYPGEEVLRRGEWFAPMPPAVQRLRDRLWTEIKAAV